MGQFFIWKPEYSVGIEKIDNQHKKLIGMINDLYDAFTNKTSNDKLVEILNQLTDYSLYHFSTEEQLFTASKYPASISHIEEHMNFKKTISEMMDNIKSRKAAVTYKLMTFLNSWLKNHIIEEDQKYSIHIQKYLQSEEHHVV